MEEYYQICSLFLDPVILLHLRNKTLQARNITQLLNTVQWLFDFKQFDWFAGHRLPAHILEIDYIWKTPETEVIFELAASLDIIYFQINIYQ